MIDASVDFQVDQSHMKWLDRVLQNWRARAIQSYIVESEKLLDVGCFDGLLIRKVSNKFQQVVGVDPLVTPFEAEGLRIYQTTFPGDVEFSDNEFDYVTMLAVLEHAKDKELLASEVFRVLKPNGKLLITVPHPFVDKILSVLIKLRLVGGMSLDEHHGFDSSQTPAIFEAAGLVVQNAFSFQMGLNKGFVFKKP